MMIKPVSDNVVLEVAKEESEMTNTGIYLPKSAQNTRSNKGTVVAVGSGRVLNSGQKIAPEVEVGDVVIFNEFAGTKIEANDKEYLVIKENDIIVKIKE